MSAPCPRDPRSQTAPPATFSLEWPEEPLPEEFREVADWYLQMRDFFELCIQGAGKA